MPITHIFIKGLTLNNQSKKECSYGGYGCYIIFSNTKEESCSKPLEGDKITCKIAEFLALKYSLEIIVNSNIKDLIYIYIDNVYIINIFTNCIKKWIVSDWKKSDGNYIDNYELIKEIYEYILENNIKVFFKQIKTYHIKPEQNTDAYFLWNGNNKANELAIYSSNLSKERYQELNEIDKEIKKKSKIKKLNNKEI